MFMKVKKVLTLASAFVVLCSYSQNQPNVTINGVLNNATGDEVVSLREFTGNNPPITSSRVGKEGNFLLNTYVEKPDIYKLQISDNNFISLILDKGDIVSISSDAGNLKNDLKISGSQQMALLYNAGNRINYYELKLDSINKQFKEFQKSGADIEKLSPLRDEYSRINKEKDDFIINFINSNSESLACLFFIDKIDIGEHFKVYDSLDRSLNKKHPENVYVKNLHARVESERNLAIGSVAPNITLPDPDGNMKSLSSLRGKIVLIDFWAAWCGPCRRENPHVVKLYSQYHDKGFDVFGVSLDRSRESWLNAIESDGLTWTQVSDLKYWQSEAAKLYQVKSIPHTMLIDRDGKIIAKKLRGEALEEKLKELFGE